MSTGIAKKSNAPMMPHEEVRHLLMTRGLQFLPAIAKYMPLEELAATIALAVARNPGLAECTPSSIALSALTIVVGWKVSPDPIVGEAYLVPFKDKKTGEKVCTPIFGYMGKIKDARRGGLQRIRPEVVCENDEFDQAEGAEPRLVHKIKYPRGKVIGAYAVVWLKDNPYPDWAYMPVEEIEYIRQRSPGANSPAWTDHYEEQCKKTAIHRVMKRNKLDRPPQDALFAALDEDPDAQEHMKRIFPLAPAALPEPGDADTATDAPPAAVAPPPPPPPKPKANPPAKAPAPVASAAMPAMTIIGPLTQGLSHDTILGFVRSEGGCPLVATSLDQCHATYLAAIQADPEAWKQRLNATLPS